MADYRPVAPQSNTTVAPQAPRGQVNTGNSIPVQRARQEHAQPAATTVPVELSTTRGAVETSPAWPTAVLPALLGCDPRNCAAHPSPPSRSPLAPYLSLPGTLLELRAFGGFRSHEGVVVPCCLHIELIFSSYLFFRERHLKPLHLF